MAVIIGRQWVEEGRPDRQEYYINSVAFKNPNTEIQKASPNP